MPPTDKLISAKHLVGRQRLLPEEIYQAHLVVIDEKRKLVDLKRRVEDLKSELLTQENSPITGKNQEIREAQLHERLGVWGPPLADQEQALILAIARWERLLNELDSLGHITNFIIAHRNNVRSLATDLLEIDE
jgi:hypothetical protein